MSRHTPSSLLVSRLTARLVLVIPATIVVRTVLSGGVERSGWFQGWLHVPLLPTGGHEGDHVPKELVHVRGWGDGGEDEEWSSRSSIRP